MKQIITLNRDMKDDYHYNEAIKTLRTNIQFCGNGIRTIMLTSSLPDEGKSDITFADVYKRQAADLAISRMCSMSR